MKKIEAYPSPPLGLALPLSSEEKDKKAAAILKLLNGISQEQARSILKRCKGYVSEFNMLCMLRDVAREFWAQQEKPASMEEKPC